MVFGNFFKPKWRHKNPRIRRQALLDLGRNPDAHQDVFAQVAAHDSDPVLRQLAAEQLTHMDALQQVAAGDADATVREKAHQRLCRVVAGADPSGVTAEQRLEWFSAQGDPRLAEYVVRHGDHTALRRAALERVAREALIGDVAVADPDPDIRLQALGRVERRTTLERILDETRTRDKRISAVAQARLDELREEEARPDHLRQQARSLCLKLEGLVNALAKQPDPEQVRTQWHSLEGQWEQARQQWREEYGAWPADTAARFAAACDACKQYVERRPQEQAREQEQMAAAEARRQLCERLEAALATAPGDLQAFAALENELELVLQSWRQLPALNSEEGEAWDGRLAAIRQRAEGLREDRERLDAALQAAQRLLDDARPLLAAQAAPEPRTVQELERHWRRQERPLHFPMAAAPVQELESALRELRQRMDAQAGEVTPTEERFRQHVDAAAAALADGHVQQADQSLRDAQGAWRQLPDAEQARLRRRRIYKRYNATRGRLRELRDWQAWASVPVRERLCREAQILASGIPSDPHATDFDFAAAARTVQQLRERWKELGPSEEDGVEVLWERFNDACNRAYEPCQAFFEMEARQRDANEQARIDLCDEMDAYVAEHVTGKPTADLDGRRLSQDLRRFQQRWTSIGPTNRKAQVRLNKRFRDGLQLLRDGLERHRERNASRKESLIKQVERLRADLGDQASADQLRTAIGQVKDWQTQWKETGGAGGEKELWERFRAACDGIFTLRQAQFDFLAQERQQHLEAKREFCEQLEALAALPGDELKGARGRFEQLRSAFHNTGPVPKKEERHLQQRFQAACEAFGRAERAQREAERRNQRRLVAGKSQLCQQMERLAEQLADEKVSWQQADAERAEMRTRWQALEPAAGDMEKLLEQRFRKAEQWVESLAPDSESRDQARAHLQAQKAENLRRKEELCLRMEILAGVDSPDEAKQARMEMQVAQLADRLSAGSQPPPLAQVSDLEKDWYATGPVPSDRLPFLEQRFQQAWEAVRPE